MSILFRFFFYPRGTSRFLCPPCHSGIISAPPLSAPAALSSVFADCPVHGPTANSVLTRSPAEHRPAICLQRHPSLTFCRPAASVYADCIQSVIFCSPPPPYGGSPAQMPVRPRSGSSCASACRPRPPLFVPALPTTPFFPPPCRSGIISTPPRSIPAALSPACGGRLRPRHAIFFRRRPF